MRYIFIILALSLSSCSTHYTFRENFRQGQLLPDKAIAQIEKGMSPAEVIHILGSPLLYNLNDTRWEYIEHTKIKGKVLKNKHLIITFSNNRVSKIEQY